MTPSAQEAGTPKARLGVSIDYIRSIATKMQASNDKEEEDYHWLIVGALVMSIALLMDHIESKT
ncbi:MAG: hypothetical protein SWH78_04325 [Thermodesulfobacteriota bacterium]|nr:hypothetical protein [Thermodesulfobacteriota bacterium]